jgi:hypothetical protein
MNDAEMGTPENPEPPTDNCVELELGEVNEMF